MTVPPHHHPTHPLLPHRSHTRWSANDHDHLRRRRQHRRLFSSEMILIPKLVHYPFDTFTTLIQVFNQKPLVGMVLEEEDTGLTCLSIMSDLCFRWLVLHCDTRQQASRCCHHKNDVVLHSHSIAGLYHCF